MEFWSLDLEITPSVLVPRPETEMLVRAASECCGDDGAALVDVGTGSGAVAVAVASELPEARVWATDVAGDALALARRNAIRHGVAERVTVLRGDLLEPLGGLVEHGSVDCVLSNPPYVRRSEAGEVDPEVLWEPAVAVFCDGPPAPLYGRIAGDAAPFLRPGGRLLLETPDRGTDALRDAVLASGEYRVCIVHEDAAGLPRMLEAERR